MKRFVTFLSSLLLTHASRCGRNGYDWNITSHIQVRVKTGKLHVAATIKHKHTEPSQTHGTTHSQQGSTPPLRPCRVYAPHAPCSRSTSSLQLSVTSYHGTSVSRERYLISLDETLTRVEHNIEQSCQETLTKKGIKRASSI